MTFYLLKPCKTTVGFISTLKKRTRLDLKEAKGKLEAAGYRITDVEVMLILEGPAELTLYESGKLLLKIEEKAEAQRVSDTVYSILGLSEKPAGSPA